MDFWVSERCQVRTLQASLHEKTLIYSAFSVFDLGYYWLHKGAFDTRSFYAEFLFAFCSSAKPLWNPATMAGFSSYKKPSKSDDLLGFF